MKRLTEKQGLERLEKLRNDFRAKIARDFEHRAKSCETCETKGACCLDEHFVNVHVSRLEAVAIKNALDDLPKDLKTRVFERIESSILKYRLDEDGDSFAKTYACPLFEKDIGCLVHQTAKPAPCINHACYERRADLPPDELLSDNENKIDRLNSRIYDAGEVQLPIPVALKKIISKC